jgi:hypothetical protein
MLVVVELKRFSRDLIPLLERLDEDPSQTIVNKSGKRE